MSHRLDARTAARFLIRRHGREAATYATLLADSRRDSGDIDGAADWLAVARSIGEFDGDEYDDLEAC